MCFETPCPPTAAKFDPWSRTKAASLVEHLDRDPSTLALAGKGASRNVLRNFAPDQAMVGAGSKLLTSRLLFDPRKLGKTFGSCTHLDLVSGSGIKTSGWPKKNTWNKTRPTPGNSTMMFKHKTKHTHTHTHQK